MSARLLLEVTLRVLGLWALYMALTDAVDFAAVMLPVYGSGAVGGVPPGWLSDYVGRSLVHCLLGTLLIWWAPRIAARFYPAGVSEAEVHLNVGPGDVYRIACFVLGLYLLVNTAQPASRLVAAAMQGAWSGRQGEMIGQAQISREHGNFILNLGGATASDVVQLIARIKTAARDRFGLQLQEEVEYVGF